MIRIGICDDDKEFAHEFQGYVRKYFDIYSGLKEEIKCIYYSDAREVIDNFLEDDIHIYFLDIELGECTGMEIARKLEKMRHDLGIVYMTNYERYATKAFVCRPLGFIRKKYIEEDMGMAMVSIGEYLEKDRIAFRFKDNTKEIPVLLGNVQYVQVSDHTLTVVLINKKMKLRDVLSRVEEPLCEHGFAKINRSCIVNLKYIKDMQGVEIVLYNEEVLYVSEDRKREVFIKWQYYNMNF